MRGQTSPRHILLALGIFLGSLAAVGAVALGPRSFSLGHVTPTPTGQPAVTSSTAPLPSPSPGSTATPAPSATATPWPTVVVDSGHTLQADGQERSIHVPILMYHYVSDLPADADVYRVDLSVPVQSFEAQLAYLKAAGYTSITLDELALYLAEGHPSLPPKPIILTFDDGYEDAFLYAFPLLRQYGFRGTFFIVTQFVDQGLAGYVTWEQLGLMQANGMDIEAHSVTHADLRTLGDAAARQEVEESRQSIEAHLHKPVRFFAYPSGRYNARTIALLREAGYWGAVTTEAGVSHSTQGLYEMLRVRVRGSHNLEQFQAVLDYYGQ